MTNNIIIPLRGEIWEADLNPTIGSEMDKIRPVVVISTDEICCLPLKIVALITGWKEKFSKNIFLVKITADKVNNLEKDSAITVLQVRSLDHARFIRKVGNVPADVMEEVVSALAAVVEYQ